MRVQLGDTVIFRAETSAFYAAIVTNVYDDGGVADLICFAMDGSGTFGVKRCPVMAPGEPGRFEWCFPRAGDVERQLHPDGFGKQPA